MSGSKRASERAGPKVQRERSHFSSPSNRDLILVDCRGNQPFALVSNCLRESLKRAAAINAHPLFLTYELGPITSDGQLAALGIDPACVTSPFSNLRDTDSLVCLAAQNPSSSAERCGILIQSPPAFPRLSLNTLKRHWQSRCRLHTLYTHEATARQCIMQRRVLSPRQSHQQLPLWR